MVRLAFTLVELLIVVAIIAILLALLTPAIEKAVYQAELVRCATNLRAATSGVVGYAFDHGRRFPYRGAYRNGFGLARPNMMKFRDQVNDLNLLAAYVPLKMLIDPLTNAMIPADIDEGQDLDTDSALFIDYAAWYDFGYRAPDGGATASRLGRGFEFDGATYSVLFSDMDLVVPTALGDGGHYDTSHPGKGGAGQLVVWKNQLAPVFLTTLTEKSSTSYWIYVGHSDTFDMNFAMSDSSVHRVNDVDWQDPRLARVPTDSHHDKSLMQLQYIQIVK